MDQPENHHNYLTTEQVSYKMAAGERKVLLASGYLAPVCFLVCGVN